MVLFNYPTNKPASQCQLLPNDTIGYILDHIAKMRTKVLNVFYESLRTMTTKFIFTTDQRNPDKGFPSVNVA